MEEENSLVILHGPTDAKTRSPLPGCATCLVSLCGAHPGWHGRAFTINTDGTISPTKAKHLVLGVPMSAAAKVEAYLKVFDECKAFVAQIQEPGSSVPAGFKDQREMREALF